MNLTEEDIGCEYVLIDREIGSRRGYKGLEYKVDSSLNDDKEMEFFENAEKIIDLDITKLYIRVRAYVKSYKISQCKYFAQTICDDNVRFYGDFSTLKECYHYTHIFGDFIKDFFKNVYEKFVEEIYSYFMDFDEIRKIMTLNKKVSKTPFTIIHIYFFVRPNKQKDNQLEPEIEIYIEYIKNKTIEIRIIGDRGALTNIRYGDPLNFLNVNQLKTIKYMVEYLNNIPPLPDTRRIKSAMS